MSQDQKTTNNQTRSIARQLAREVHPEEMDAIAAGTTSCVLGRPADCDPVAK
jgi:hypothetical protein